MENEKTMEERKYCWQCGTANPIYARFCSSCGASFEKDELPPEDTDGFVSDVSSEEEVAQDLKPLPEEHEVTDKNEESSRRRRNLAVDSDQQLARDAENRVARMRQLRDDRMTVQQDSENDENEPSQDAHREIAAWKIICIVMASVVVVLGIVILLLWMLSQPGKSEDSSVDSSDSSQSQDQSPSQGSSSQPDESNYPMVNSIVQECMRYSTGSFILSPSSDGATVNMTFYVDDMNNNMGMIGCLAQQFGGENSMEGAMRMSMDFIKLATPNLLTSVDQVANVSWSEYGTVKIRCGVTINDNSVIACQATDLTTDTSNYPNGSISQGDSSSGASTSQGQTDRRSPEIAGLYCRNNGACISIAKSGNILLTETDSTMIDDSARSGDYPFSSYLQDITLADMGKEESQSGVMEFTMQANGDISCAPGTISMSSCDAPDGSYMYLDIAFYYVPKGMDIDQVQSEASASIDGAEPDTSKPYLVFQKEAGTNAPFDASDDAVFYFVQ